MDRGRRRSVYTLDEVRPFLSLIGNARFEPICVAPRHSCQLGLIAIGEIFFSKEFKPTG